MIGRSCRFRCSIGAVAGLPLLVAHGRQRGFVWLRVLPGASADRLCGDRGEVSALRAAAAAGRRHARCGRSRRNRRLGSERRGCRAVASGPPRGCRGVLVVLLVLAPLRVAPYFSIYQNAIGAASAPPAHGLSGGGVRLRRAGGGCGRSRDGRPGSALIVSDAALVVDYYLAATSRRGSRSRGRSRGTDCAAHGEQWVFVQDSHIYFENADARGAAAARRTQPWREYRLRGTTGAAGLPGRALMANEDKATRYHRLRRRASVGRDAGTGCCW